MTIIKEKNNKNTIAIKSIIESNIKEIDINYSLDVKNNNLTTSFFELDNKISGLKNSDLILIASRPGHGKTTLALNIAEENASNGHNIFIFSPGMTKEQLGYKLLSSLGKINHTRLINGKLKDDDWNKLTKATQKLNESNIFINDKADITINELYKSARKIKQVEGLDLLIVDDIQLIKLPDVNIKEKELQLDIISKKLKVLAKELKIPIIALSQLNNSIENRTNKRPMMSDLIDLKGFEENADLILFIYRTEMNAVNSSDNSMAEIIIGKHRNGPVGTIKLSFVGEYAKFENITNVYEFSP